MADEIARTGDVSAGRYELRGAGLMHCAGLNPLIGHDNALAWAAAAT